MLKKTKRVLGPVCVVLLAQAGGGFTMTPAVEPHERNSRVTLGCELATESLWGQQPRIGTFAEWYQKAEVNSQGQVVISGTNPNGNGAVKTSSSVTIGRITWNSGNNYAWRLPSRNKYVEYVNIDLTGYENGDSVRVWAWVCAREGNAGPFLHVNGSGYAWASVGTEWEQKSITRSGGTLEWNSADNYAGVTHMNGTDTMAVGQIGVHIYGAVPIQAPGPFNLTWPLHNCTNQPASGTLRWSSSNSATYYEVWFGTSHPLPFLRSTPSLSTDYSGTGGQTYHWQVRAVNDIGKTYSANGPFTFTTAGGAIEEPTAVVPVGDVLCVNAPEPFRSHTTIRFSLTRSTRILASIVNNSGELIWTHQMNLPHGEHSLTWNGRDQAGENVPCGVYFCRLIAGDRTLTRKMVKAD